LDIAIGLNEHFSQAPLGTPAPANWALMQDAMPDTGILAKGGDVVVYKILLSHVSGLTPQFRDDRSGG
jgi:hypothetical protein